LEKERPDLVLVYGDTNSTLAGALVAAKMGMPLGHVEAGLRSFNREMPEEVNRVVADHLSSLLFAPTETAVSNLTREGITRGVHLVGDVMYDVALQSAQSARSRDTVARLGLTRGEYILVTLHRPQNVDQKETLSSIVEALVNAGRPVVFPVHPRTRKNLAAFGLWDRLSAKVKAIEPVDYLDFIALLMASAKVVTDSGEVVPHRVLRGKIAGKDEIVFEGVVRCSKCDAISNVVTREPKPIVVPLILSWLDRSEKTSLEFSPDEDVAIGEELDLGDTRIAVTAIESGGRRVDAATAKAVDTIWAKRIDQVRVKFS